MQFYRLTLYVFVAAAVGFATYRCAHQAPLVESSVPGVEGDEDRALGRALDAQLAAIGRRLKEKDRIVGEVRAGRMSAGAARARFRELIVSDPTFLAQYRVQNPGLSDDELAARNLARHMDASKGE